MLTLLLMRALLNVIEQADIPTWALAPAAADQLCPLGVSKIAACICLQLLGSITAAFGPWNATPRLASIVPCCVTNTQRWCWMSAQHRGADAIFASARCCLLHLTLCSACCHAMQLYDVHSEKWLCWCVGTGMAAVCFLIVHVMYACERRTQQDVCAGACRCKCA